MINEAIEAKIGELRNDRIHGAGWLSRFALDIMLSAIDQSSAENIPEFTNELQSIFFKITESRQGMVPVANQTYNLLKQINKLAYTYHDLYGLKEKAKAEGDKLVRLSEMATGKAATNTANLIKNGDVIMTCSYSSLFCRSMIKAKENKKTFTVIALKSFVNGISYGEITGEELKKYGIEINIIDEENISNIILQVTKVITGADAVLTTGYFVNGAPSLILFSEASKAGISTYIACETLKFDIYNFREKYSKLESGFDQIPLDMVTGIITEKGTIAPALIPDFIEMLKED